MAIRRNNAPRKRPDAPNLATSGRLAPATENPVQQDAEHAPAEGNDSDDLRQQVLEEFRGSLHDKHGLDREEREALAHEFELALESAPRSAEIMESLDPEQWHRTIDAFVEEGLVDADEATRLRQRVDEAFRPLASGKGKLVLEFSQRLERDGEAAALEWLHTQDLAGFDEPAQPVAGILPSAARKRRVPQPQDVTASKSRRLRGPP
jgi:hypothetical protein